MAFFPPESFTCRICQRKRDEIFANSKSLAVDFCRKCSCKTCRLCNKTKDITGTIYWLRGTNLRCQTCVKKRLNWLINNQCDECFDKEICSCQDFNKNNCINCEQEWAWKDHVLCATCDEKENPYKNLGTSEIAPPRNSWHLYHLLSLSVLALGILIAIVLWIVGKRKKAN